MKNKPELKQPQFSHENEFIETEKIKLTLFDKFILYSLPIIIIMLFIICIFKIIIN